MGLGRGHVEISQTRFPQAHTLHRFNNTETTLTSRAPEAVQTTGSTSELDVLQPRIERELLEVLPEVGGHLEIEIDQRLGDGLPKLERAHRAHAGGRAGRFLLRGKDGAGVDG